MTERGAARNKNWEMQILYGIIPQQARSMYTLSLRSRRFFLFVCLFMYLFTVRSCATKKINNGRFWPAKTTINSGLSIKFQCDAGYHLSGSRYSTCWNGRWNRAFPSCSKSNDDQCKSYSLRLLVNFLGMRVKELSHNYHVHVFNVSGPKCSRTFCITIKFLMS